MAKAKPICYCLDCNKRISVASHQRLVCNTNQHDIRWYDSEEDLESDFYENITAAWQHEYYDDTGGRSRSTSVDFFDWEEFKSHSLQGKKIQHLKSTRLVLLSDVEFGCDFLKKPDGNPK